jgi:hypothetical protein
MLSLLVAAIVVLATLAEVDAPFKQLDLDRAQPPLPDNVAAYEPIARDLRHPKRIKLAQMRNDSYRSDAESESP